jgi:hypothetical protein
MSIKKSEKEVVNFILCNKGGVGENNISPAATWMIEFYCMVSIGNFEIENLRRGIERRNFLCRVNNVIHILF